MEILIVRHGQSLGDVEDRHEGRADLPLTELGKDQAHRAADWIKSCYPSTHVITSPLKRAAETAEFIAGRLNAPLATDNDLMEWNNGLLAGMPKDEAARRFPQPDGGRPPHDTHYETESLIQFRARADTFWSKLINSELNQPENRICLVSHGGMINMLFRSFLNLPPEVDLTFHTGDTGMHMWKVDGGERTLYFSNRQDHLWEG